MMGVWAVTQVSPECAGGNGGGRFCNSSVLCVTGHGGFGQYPWEVATAVKYGMNIISVLLNNNELREIGEDSRLTPGKCGEHPLCPPASPGL